MLNTVTKRAVVPANPTYVVSMTFSAACACSMRRINSL